MNEHAGRVLKVVLLVSCAHALVHLLEQSIASVELVISHEFALSLQASGLLGMALRLPYGLGAYAAGVLADRFGEKRILVIYLLGAATMSVGLSTSGSVSIIYAQLFGLGAFASMYHPAGLALLANQTTPAERSRALGLHGVFGSLGIASAPFIAGFLLTLRPGDWRGYYLLLAAISGTLGLLVWWLLKPVPHDQNTQDHQTGLPLHDPAFDRKPYALLVIGTAVSGMVYGGVLHFLPRYLSEANVFSGWLTSADEAALGNYTAAIALICGAFGQWVAGRLATPNRLPLQLSAIYGLNIPFLIWMTFAEGTARLIAACLWAFFHFMNQPVYNSLLPEYLPRRRRSAGYGFSNLMGFGVGAVGPYIVAQCGVYFPDYTYSYLTLAGLAAIATVLPLPLIRHRHQERT